MRISDWSSDVCSSDLYYEQRRQFALRDAGGELDIDLLPVVEGAQRLPRRTTAADRVAEAQVLQRQPGIDRRGGPGRLDRPRTRLNSSHSCAARMPSSA